MLYPLCNVADTANADEERSRNPTFFVVDVSRGSFLGISALPLAASPLPEQVALFARVCFFRPVPDSLRGVPVDAVAAPIR